MDLATFHSIWTALLLIAFVGIVAWTWSGKRKATFDAAARMPLEDDATHDATVSKENGHG